MQLLLGRCSRSAHATGADQVPAVREKLGQVSAVEATIAGRVHEQIQAAESWPERICLFQPVDHVCRPRLGHAEYSKFIDELRELGGVFQMPADIAVMEDHLLARQFTTFWQTPQCDAVTRMKLFKLAWYLVGSEFAGRHQQYEKFCAGASFIVRNHSY